MCRCVSRAKEKLWVFNQSRQLRDALSLALIFYHERKFVEGVCISRPLFTWSFACCPNIPLPRECCGWLNVFVLSPSTCSTKKGDHDSIKTQTINIVEIESLSFSPFYIFLTHSRTNERFALELSWVESSQHQRLGNFQSLLGVRCGIIGKVSSRHVRRAQLNRTPLLVLEERQKIKSKLWKKSICSKAHVCITLMLNFRIISKLVASYENSHSSHVYRFGNWNSLKCFSRVSSSFVVRSTLCFESAENNLKGPIIRIDFS